ncbi:hypothetical protein [Desulfobulbus sp.]|uniref:hypothetical protein n=1 Tax=Desulfobulbus sp. TaxID=895 RepID=UPI00286F86DE|nr:hypothetical protein [Desulfobulbus sp.]
MHTDEYEISINRELNHHQHVVKKIRATLAERRQRYKMDYAEAAEAAAAGRLVIAAKELAAWQEDVEALPQWEQRLDEYRKALAMMRISASRS